MDLLNKLFAQTDVPQQKWDGYAYSQAELEQKYTNCEVRYIHNIDDKLFYLIDFQTYKKLYFNYQNDENVFYFIENYDEDWSDDEIIGDIDSIHEYECEQYEQNYL